MEEVVSFQVGLEAWCKEFYSKLHIKEACDTNFVEIKNDFLRILKNKIHEQMKCNLTQPITKAKLVTLNAMAKGKGLGPNGVVVEVFQRVWLAIGIGYIKMVQSSIQKGRFPLRVTKGLITLLHKGRVYAIRHKDNCLLI